MRELDGLAAIMDSHFAYEERRIGQALDALGTDALGGEAAVAAVLTVERLDAPDRRGRR